MSTAIFVGERVPWQEGERVTARSQRSQILLRFRSDRWAMTGFGLIIVLVAAAVFAPLAAHLTGHGPNELFPSQVNASLALPNGPSTNFLFGVDQDGRDVFVRCLYGLRTSLEVSLLATAIATCVGVTAGIAAGYLGGWLDTFVSRFADVFLALPVVLFAISISSVCSISTRGCMAGTISPGVGLVVTVLALFTWPYIARIVRGQTIALREREFVRSARALGASRRQAMFSEILPNLAAQVIVYVTLIVPSNVLFEAALSYLGVGIPQTTPSLGQMLSDATSGSLFTYAWWMMVFPGALLLLVTLAFNMVGDGLRDAIDG
jgi:peptide/nickel transport system permease protein